MRTQNHSEIVGNVQTLIGWQMILLSLGFGMEIHTHWMMHTTLAQILTRHALNLSTIVSHKFYHVWRTHFCRFVCLFGVVVVIRRACLNTYRYGSFENFFPCGIRLDEYQACEDNRVYRMYVCMYA